MKLIIFGHRGYMGSAIVAECELRGIKWHPGRRDGVHEVMYQLTETHADAAINAAAFIPGPTVDRCKDHPDETIAGNVWWPSVLRSACEITQKTMVHLSTGCLFNEEREYTENDEPTRGWDGYCGFYVGTKKLSERVVRGYVRHYILRLRLPFDHKSSMRNYLNKLKGFKTVFEHINSLTHRGDFSKWTLDLLEKQSEYGTYHCVNDGQISAEDIMAMMLKKGKILTAPSIVPSPDTTGARLSCAKLKNAGVQVRHVGEAIEESISNWNP